MDSFSCVFIAALFMWRRFFVNLCPTSGNMIHLLVAKGPHKKIGLRSKPYPSRITNHEQRITNSTNCHKALFP